MSPAKKTQGPYYRASCLTMAPLDRSPLVLIMTGTQVLLLSIIKANCNTVKSLSDKLKLKKMKRSLLGLALTCMVILSCKKQSSDNSNPKPDKEQHVITFNVGFSQQTSDFKVNSLKTNSTATNALTDQVDVMYLAIYNPDGTFVHLLKKLSTDSGFGSFTDTLNYGNYTAVVAAGKTGLVLSTDYTWFGGETGGQYAYLHKLSTDILLYKSNDTPTGYITNFNKDAFYKKLALTIPQTGSINVSLDRITSQVQVVIEDAIPANAKTLALEISSIGEKYYIGSGTPKTITLNTYETYSFLTPTDIGKINYSFNTGVFLAMPSSTQSIYCSSGTTINNLSPDIASLTIPNVSCLPNKKTVLTGNLFGGAGKPAGNGFHLVADTSWNSTTINRSF
ncbi:FimB/Mfa2 family fimbrial subunit [Mucilaginibacter rubeus]|uniref:FimB/Mfa2 family fimbrial subunit n=1 Tax=Mucilaginibacter rubeus TaxID=2027860 RepID=A0A5C1I215_9SPHI|nr:FimB/Mfa2 family fimbrial subunit [Mucilaginibacter rubeus]QEM11983.1 FimB/Mfa2 family fimbrial subunit [Mucilaginibacter rubeus]